MGWTYRSNDKTPQSVIERFIYQNDEAITLKHFYDDCGNGKGVLYVAQELPQHKRRFIEIVLLGYHPTNDCWGYCPQDCCMGPLANTCPIDILDLCPPHNAGYCHNFHHRCRMEHARLTNEPTLFAALIKNGIEIDNHESDLYFPNNEITRKLLRKFPLEQSNSRDFTHVQKKERWIDVPFAFAPWWDAHREVYE